MERSERRGRPRKFDGEAVLGAAMAEFWEHGFGGTSLADLEAATGLSAPSIYNAFGSKDGLYGACLDHYERRIARALTAGLDPERPSRDAVAQMLGTAARQYTTRGRPRGCMFVLSALGAGERDSAAEDACRERRASSLAGLESYLRSAQRKGVLPLGADPRALARYLVAIMQGMSVQARDGAGRRELEQLAEQAMSVWPEGR